MPSKEYSHNYYLANKDRYRENSKKWREEHKAEIKEKSKKYNEEHKKERKECSRKYYLANIEHEKEYDKLHKNDSKDWHLKRKYNISLKVQEDLLVSQDNKCGICGDTFTDENFPHVDHVHDETNKVRGLLCRNCNMGLGLLQDNPEIIQNAIAWLRKDA